MSSLIFNGFVEHERLKPLLHSFRYRIYVYGVFLDELEQLERNLPLFGYNRFRPTSIHDEDYLDEGQGSVQEKLFRFLHRKGLGFSVSRVMLITSARFCGRVFNPVSFYYCFGGDGGIECMAAEVNNTFGERHLYLLGRPREHSEGFRLVYRAPKEFHVSPFNNMDGEYEFRFSTQLQKELDIGIRLHREGDVVFKARLWGRPAPFDSLNHLRTMLASPLVPRLTMPRILWEAGRLHFRKGLQVHTRPGPRSPMTIRRIPATALQRTCRKAVTDILQRMETGRLELVLPEGETLTFGASQNGPFAQLKVNDHRFFSRVVLHGDIGFGDAYVQGDWDSEDPAALLGLLIENRDRLQDGNLVFSWLTRAAQTFQHWMRKNTIEASPRNIGAHYDLSNDFFALFLDPGMTYSCALYKDARENLEQAQQNKLWAIIEKGRIGRDDHVLEIGCGWGSFAIEAVKKTGCRVTGITVSQNQYRLARERVKRAGLEDRITILLQDYRHVQGAFEKIVSIEMLEAVGHEYFGTFFQCCDRLLKPHGVVVLQVITIPDQRYESYRKNCDWIQKNIFPGGLLPSLLTLSQAMAAHSSFIMEEMENIGAHYAPTLSQWRRTFVENEDRIAQLGFDWEFRRKWLYYFCYCEAAFSTRTLGDIQMVLTRPNNRNLRFSGEFLAR